MCHLIMCFLFQATFILTNSDVHVTFKEYWELRLHLFGQDGFILRYFPIKQINFKLCSLS